jgi:hypothetical protein
MVEHGQPDPPDKPARIRWNPAARQKLQQYHVANTNKVPLFQCTFTLATDNETTIVVPGWTVAQPSDENAVFHEVNCPSPGKQEKKVTFRLSLEWVDSKGAVEIPYEGMNDIDLVLFDMTWSKIDFKNANVFVDVDGLDQDAKYTCRFTQADNDEIVKNTDAKFVDGAKGFRLLCGQQPTGFTIDKDGFQAVKFELFVKGSKTQASFAGVAGDGPELKLSICNNKVAERFYIFPNLLLFEVALASWTRHLPAVRNPPGGSMLHLSGYV